MNRTVAPDRGCSAPSSPVSVESPIDTTESLFGSHFKPLLQPGDIPGSSQTKARESALQERMGPASCGPATMESGNGALCWTGRVVEADIDLCRGPGRISRARGRGRF